MSGRRGFDLDAPFRSYVADSGGVIVVHAEELDRVELRTGAGAGHLVTAIGPALLPVGSRFDAKSGVFTWQPGVGFVGAYEFLFDTQRVRIVLHPQGSNRVGGQVVIDAPARDSGVLPAGASLVVAGWAADLESGADPGVATVHVWAYPLTSARRHGAPVFLGAADYGGARPDVAAIFGERFARTGYGLVSHDLPPGTYDLAVFAYSTVTNGFLPARIVRVVVK